jgi:DNA-binding NarL/FixJ family response regulator
MTLRILIVDDHPLFRAQAHELFASAGWDVTGEAADGAEAVAATQRLAPDVVLLDVQLPDTDGFAVAARLADLAPGVRVVLTSVRDASMYRARLRRSPQLPFVAKRDLSPDTLTHALGGV